MDIVINFAGPVIIFLLAVAAGFWLSRSGKPLKTGIFTVHKLIALAALVVAALQTSAALKTAAIQPIVIALLVVIGLCAVALFVTGALMSANKPAYRALLTAHRIAPALSIMAGAATIYLLAWGTS